MLHVDEGTLHAYLDALERGPAAGALAAAERSRVDAHLARCPECAAALAEAGALRQQAAAVLSGAAPAIDMPPFETMSARRPGRRPAPRWVPLAWAASLVVAVGSGWIASELWRRGAVIGPADARPPGQVAETAADRSSSPRLADTEAVEPQAGAPARAASSPAVDEAVAEPRPAATRTLESREASAATRSATGAGVPAGVAAAKAREATEVDARAEPGQAQAAVEPRQAGPPTPVAGDPVGQLRSAAPGAAAPPVVRLQEAAAPARPGPASARDTLGYAGEAAVAWESISLAAAARRLGAPLELLADAIVVSVAGAEPGVVRVRQRLSSGAEAELVQWPLEPRSQQANDGVAAAASERAAVRVIREGIASDGRAWVLLARPDRMLAIKAPPGVLPLGLLPQLERER